MPIKSAGSARWTIAVSYANNRSFGSLDPYIDELYVLAESGVTDIGCEIACINHAFFLAVAQNFYSERFMEVFLNELASVGIDYEVMNSEHQCLCGLEPYGSR